jgi:hypothetical protein
MTNSKRSRSVYCLQVTKVVNQDDFEAGKVTLAASVAAASGKGVAIQASASTDATLPQTPAMAVIIAVTAGQPSSIRAAGTAVQFEVKAVNT